MPAKKWGEKLRNIEPPQVTNKFIQRCHLFVYHKQRVGNMCFRVGIYFLEIDAIFTEIFTYKNIKPSIYTLLTVYKNTLFCYYFDQILSIQCCLILIKNVPVFLVFKHINMYFFISLFVSHPTRQ